MFLKGKYQFHSNLQTSDAGMGGDCPEWISEHLKAKLPEGFQSKGKSNLVPGFLNRVRVVNPELGCWAGDALAALVPW